MDYKKKYKEALERAKDFMNGEVHYALRRGENIMCWIFPELKESEDERIRKAIEYAIGQSTHSDGTLINGVSSEEAIAWLEKQGEQNHTDKVEPKFKVGDIIYKPSNSSCPVHSSIDGTLCTVIEVLDKHYILDTNEGRIQESFAWQDYYELVKQKPAWSEEDGPYYDDICEILINLLHSETADVNKDAVQKDLDWLISLEERVQPKVEWSEEDSMFIKILRTMIAAYVKDDEERKKLVRWLDIHCNAYPIPSKLYPSWKPSDEQMADLWNMVCECRPAEQQLLQDIYYGLKTLRGE